MTLWIAWSLLVSALIALAATAVDRTAALLGGTRRFVWLGAMVCATIVPLGAAVPRNRTVPDAVPIHAATAAQATRAGFAETFSVTDVRPAGQPIAAPSAPHPSAWDRGLANIPERARPFDPWIARAWLAASATLTLIFAAAMLRLHRRRAHWHEMELGPCRGLVAPDAGPAVVGFARPRIVIPTWVLQLEASARSLLLRHELEHIEAGDPRTMLAAGALIVALPWNAALWWMLGRLRLAVEIDCDARVVTAVGSAHDYGMVLLAVGERRIISLPFSASLTDARPSLERRIDAMTTPRPRRPLLASLPFVAIALVAMTAASNVPRPQPLRTLGRPPVKQQPIAARPAFDSGAAGRITKPATVAARTKSAGPAVGSTPDVDAKATPQVESGDPAVRDRVESPIPVPTERRPLLLAVAHGGDSGQVAQPHGEVLLDSLLGQGRSRPGLRVDSTRLRPYFDGVIGNPFVPMLVLASDLALSRSQTDSVVASLARFERLSDSAWTPVVAYLARQPDNYDIDAAWNQLLGAADMITQRMLADGAALKGTLTPTQLSHMPLDLRSYLEPACAGFFHQRVSAGLHSVPRAQGTFGPPSGRAAGGLPSQSYRVCSAVK